jgi:hypothetical protein
MRATAFAPVLALATALLVAAPAPAKEPETDLLENGDFEKGVAGWRVLNMSGSSSFEPDKKVKKSGEQSLRIEKTGPDKNDWLKQSTKLPHGVKEVVARCWFKVDKGARAEVEVYFFDATDQTVGKGYVSLVASGPNKKWEKAEERLEVPKGAVGVGVNVKVTARGTFWLDGLSVSYAGGGWNGGFEAGLAGWSPLEHGSGAAQAEADGSVHAGGKGSARVARTSPRLLPEDGLAAELAVSSGPQRVRFQVRVDGAARASVALQAFDVRGVCVATARSAVATAGTAFAPGEATIDVPAGAKRLTVSLVVVGAGTAWFDDVSVSGGK